MDTKEIIRFRAHDAEVLSLAIIPDSGLLASGGADWMAHVWRLRSDYADVERWTTIRSENNDVRSIAFIQRDQEKVLVFACSDHRNPCLIQVLDGDGKWKKEKALSLAKKLHGRAFSGPDYPSPEAQIKIFAMEREFDQKPTTAVAFARHGVMAYGYEDEFLLANLPGEKKNPYSDERSDFKTIEKGVIDGIFIADRGLQGLLCVQGEEPGKRGARHWKVEYDSQYREWEILLDRLIDYERIAFDPVNSIAAMLLGQQISLYSLSTRREIEVIPVSAPETITCLALSPMGTLLAGRSDGSLSMRTVSDRDRDFTFPVFHKAVTALAFSPDQPIFAIGSESGEITLWKTSPNVRPQVQAQLKLEEQLVQALAEVDSLKSEIESLREATKVKSPVEIAQEASETVTQLMELINQINHSDLGNEEKAALKKPLFDKVHGLSEMRRVHFDEDD